MSEFNVMETFTQEELDILDGILLEGAMPISGTTSGATPNESATTTENTTPDKIEDLEEEIVAETRKQCVEPDEPYATKDTPFPTNSEYSKPITKQDILNMFKNVVHFKEQAENDSVDKDFFGNQAKYSDFSTTEEGHRKRQESFNNNKTSTQADSPIMYQKNTYVDENGETQSCTEMAMKVDTSKFDFDFESDTEESAINNVETLKALYSNIVKKKLGGFDRVTSIRVINGKVIFNKNIFVNLLPSNKQDILNLQNGLPLDLFEYIKEGMTGYIFDWSLLLRCRNLRSLIFDDFDFVSDVVAVDLNMYYIRDEYFFTYLRHLQYLKMGEYEYTDKEPQTEEEKMKEKQQRISAAREQSFFGRAKEYFKKSTFDYGRLKPTNWTDKLDNHFHMCFKDYLKNRGKKGLIRYCGGVIVRGIFAAASTLLNAGTHFVGDSVSYVSQYKPRVVEMDDFYNIKQTVWEYTPNKRTEEEKPEFTSGDKAVNQKFYQERKEQREFNSKQNNNSNRSNKGKKSTKSNK